MLVIVRKLREEIVLEFEGREARVSVLKVEGPDRLLLGIDAPRDVRVLRAELGPLRDGPPPPPRHRIG